MLYNILSLIIFPTIGWLIIFLFIFIVYVVVVITRERFSIKKINIITNLWKK